MVQISYLLTALAAGLQLALARRDWAQSTAVVCPTGIRPRDTLPGRWETINGTIFSTPVAVSWGPDRLDVFGFGPENNLVHRSGDGCVWSEWEDPGNLLTSYPTAVAWRGNRIDVFARGSDGALNGITLEGTSWSGWYSLGSPDGGGLQSAAPAPISSGPDRLDVFVAAADGILGQISYNPVSRTWSGWSLLIQLPRIIEGLSPVPVYRGGDRLDVFYLQRNDAQLIHAYSDGHDWAYENLGGTLILDPAAIALDTNSLHVLGVIVDYTIQHRWWNGARWSDWETVPGDLQSIYKPVVVSDRPGRIDVYAIGLDGTLRNAQWNDGVWRPGGWELIDGPTFIDVPGVVSWGTNNVDIFGLDLKQALWHNWYWYGRSKGRERLSGRRLLDIVRYLQKPNRQD